MKSYEQKNLGSGLITSRVIFEMIVKRLCFALFFNRFQKRSFCFQKKTIFKKTAFLFKTFRRQIKIVFENDCFYENDL